MRTVSSQSAPFRVLSVFATVVFMTHSALAADTKSSSPRTAGMKVGYQFYVGATGSLGTGAGNFDNIGGDADGNGFNLSLIHI